jgi:hypothetical protein
MHVRTKKLVYDINPFGYLNRASEQLRNNTIESIFYSALELRCAIEARAREQLLSVKDISKRSMHLWHAKRIMDELEKQIDGAKVGLTLNIIFKGKKIRPFTYKPIDKAILIEYGKLGNLLHFQKNGLSLDFVKKNKKWLKRVSKKINESCRGHMLRPPKWEIKCLKCKQYLSWSDIYKAKDFAICSNCKHKNPFKGEKLKMIITIRKKSKRTVELLQAERIEG